MVGRRRILVLAITAMVALVAVPCQAGFVLRVSATGAAAQADIRDDFAGNPNPGDSSPLEGHIVATSVFVVGGTTFTINTTIGSSKPLPPNDPFTRAMSVNTTTIQVSGAPLSSDVTLTVMLTDTDFAPLSPLAPTSIMSSSFTFDNLQAPKATGDFIAYLGEGLLNTEFQQNASVTTGLQSANSVSGQVVTKEIVAPSSAFALTQVAHVTFAAGSNGGRVQLDGATLVYVPEPTTFAIWGGLCGLGVACSWIRRRYSKDLTPQV